MARRQFNVFNLSFLDIMSCGFGAVILFFMIINAQVRIRSDEANVRLLSETTRLEEEVLEGRKNLVRIKNSLESTREEQLSVQGLARRLQEELKRLLEELAQYDETTLAQKDSVEKLKSDIKRLEEAQKRLSKESSEQSVETGQRLRTYVGEGNRQYLTGLKMGGKRILILVDASASMLGRTYVNVIRYRNMDDDLKRKAPKWRQVVNTVDWITTQIQPDTKFQIYTFNTQAHSVIEGTDGQWLDVGDGSKITEAVDALREKVVPADGTSLYQAFEAAKDLLPLADNVYLLTDGLPTQGRRPPATEMVRPEDRFKHFNQAMRERPKNVPINVLLYPMDGDPEAAGHYWRLALDSRGSFMAPSRDWP